MNGRIRQNSLQVFDLVNGYTDLPLIAGVLPDNDDVILSKNAADLFMQIYGYTSYEEMIGKTMKIGIQSAANLQSGYDDFTNPFGDTLAFDILELKVGAISSVENDFCTMIFFNCGFGNNPIYRHVVTDLNHAQFQYVRFLTKPGTNYKVLAEQIDKEYNKPNITIKQYQGKGLGKDRKLYQSPAGFMIYCILILILLLLLSVLQLIFRRKKLSKERQILENYGYSYGLECILRNFTILFITAIVILITYKPLITSINEFAKAHYYPPCMNADCTMVIIITIIYGIVLTCLEQILTRRKKI